MIILKKLTAITDFVTKNKTDFVEIAKDYQNIHSADDVPYTMLDYEKIMNEMYDYITSFCEYKNSGDNKYSNKVLTTSVKFYDNMFIDKKKYRRIISLSEFPYMTECFLKSSKRIQTLFDELQKSTDKETLQLLYISDNQFTKIGKVFKDDMKIYLALSTSGSNVMGHSMSPDVNKSFIDDNSPVMHKVKKKLMGAWSK